jgi:hypothetical protein
MPPSQLMKLPLVKIRNKKPNTKTSTKNLKLKNKIEIKKKIQGVARFRKIKIKFLLIRKKNRLF